MIEVEQTLLTKEEGGNCFAACLASILEVPLSVVPNGAEHWRAETDEAIDAGWEVVNQFLAQLGLDLISNAPDDVAGWRPRGFWVGIVASPRLEGSSHAVVMEGDRLVWDPHPGRDVQPVDLNTLSSIDWLFVLDPVRLARQVVRLSPSVADTVRPYLRP